MKPSLSRWILGILLALPLLSAPAGCEDSQAAAQREAAAKFDEAVAASQRALAAAVAPATTEEATNTANELRRIAQSVSQLQGGTPGQRRAAMLLAANLNRKAAELDLAVVAATESEHRLERLAVARAAAAAANLDALATPLDRVDFAAARTQLKTQRDQAEGQLRQLQTQIKALESAIGQVDRQLALTAEEARTIELQADQLRARAQTLRPREALPYIEQAAELSIRTADLRGELGRQQSERSALAPQLAGAQALGTGSESMLAVTDRAIRSLQDLSEKARDAAARARRGASEIRGSAKARMEALLSVMAGDLAARYDAAIGALERSASLAQQAASGADGMSGDSAQLAHAAARSMLAQTLLLRSATLADHAALLQQLDALGGWGESSQLAPAASRASEEAADLLSQAREAYAAALESLGMLRSPALVNSGDVIGLRARTESALAKLQPSGAGTARDAGADPEPTVEHAEHAGAGGGAPSPEALVQWINETGSSVAAMRRASRIYRSSNPSLLEALTALNMSMEPVLVSFEQAFGAMMELPAAGGMGMGAPSGAKLMSAGDSSATIQIDSPMGPQVVTAVKVDGEWFLDFDSMLDAMMPGQGAAMAAQMAPMLAMMSQAMGAAAKAFAARIDAGEFATAEEATKAFQQEMAKVAGGMMGGGF